MKKATTCVLLLSTFLLALSLWGCAGQPQRPAYVKDGKEYGKVSGAFFRHRWWNYYERGLSFADGKFFDEAVADLKEAIEQRTKDQRMARTYGMHFIDYFPHRELGIVYYELESLELAQRELELSLGQFPSAKAYFYLDRVRKALIEWLGIEVFPPKLTIGFKTLEVWTKDDPVVLSGVAEDEHYVSEINVRGVPLFLEGSQKRVRFKESLDLSQGRHNIEVVARNLSEKATKRRVVIHVDRQGPIVTLDELHFDQDLPGSVVSISGSIYDEGGVLGLSINGRPIAIEKGVEVPFTARLSIDTDSLELQARDRLGNQTSALIPLIAPLSRRFSLLLASADSYPQGYVLAGRFDRKDASPPAISLKGWADTQIVFLDKAYIEGQVSDENKIKNLTINQTPVLRRKGSHIFFSHMALLNEGENTLTIKATDEAGNTAVKEISITRLIPKALHLSERLSLTALPFGHKGAVSQAGLTFQDDLIDAMINLNRFQVVERNKLDVILEEQKFSRTQLFDRRTALRLGSLVAAQSVITGSIIETRKGIEAVARIIDTETSEILSVQDVYDEVKGLAALKSLAKGMAVKFHRDFPLVDGLVIEQKGRDIFTDLGQDVIKLGRRVVVYQEEPVQHRMSERMVGVDNKIIGRARITQVLPQMSKAALLNCKAKDVRPLCKVICE
ncbi:MAG: hypothetical protein JRI47_06665 [Deltaproteobacteria bacterium]|nr:hypothetical protein [Deltaproteobacteria bacterium]